MAFKYLCPRCHATMTYTTAISVRTTSRYECNQCGYKSRIIGQDDDRIVLPDEFMSEEEMQIKVKYMEGVLPIEKIESGDWLDLRCAVRTELKAGEYAQIPLGVAIQLPDGYEAIVAPRSSTFKKYGILLSNGIGVIDGSYCGDNDIWHFPAYATRDTVIEKNERICQFRILQNQPKVDIVAVDFLGNPDRNGIGSTGRV